MSSRTRSNSTARRLLFSALVLLVFLGVAESAARWLGADILNEAASPPPPAEDGAPNLQGNPYLLWEMVPGTRHEMGVIATINQLGLRGPELTVEKPQGVKRIIALGDSSVFGFGVGDDEVFTSVLDNRLGDGVQVINSAVPGYSTYQTLNLLEIRSLALLPDILLVACLWSDNNFDSFIDKEKLTAYASFRNGWARRARQLLGASHLYRVADYKLRVLKRVPEAQKVGWMVGRGEHIGPRRVALNDYAANLEMMVVLAHERGAEAMFMILANEEDLASSAEGPAAWDPYRQAMRDTATRHGAPLVDLPELFRSQGGSREDLFLDEMHPTALGHRIMADAVAAALTARGWPAAPIEVDPPGGPMPSYTDPFIENTAEPLPPPPPNGGPSHDLPAGEGPRLAGTVIAPQYTRGVIQVDVVSRDGEAPMVVGTVRLEAPGPFDAVLPVRPGSIQFIAYLDENGDGPGPGDTRIEMAGEPLTIPEEGELSGLLIDLSAGTAVRTFAADEVPVDALTGPAANAPAPIGGGPEAPR